MRVMVKRLLKKHKYPPEGAQEALDIVMRQRDHWADNEDNFHEAPETSLKPSESLKPSQPYIIGDDYGHGMAAEDVRHS